MIGEYQGHYRIIRLPEGGDEEESDDSVVFEISEYTTTGVLMLPIIPEISGLYTFSYSTDITDSTVALFGMMTEEGPVPFMGAVELVAGEVYTIAIFFESEREGNVTITYTENLSEPWPCSRH